MIKYPQVKSSGGVGREKKGFWKLANCVNTDCCHRQVKRKIAAYWLTPIIRKKVLDQLTSVCGLSLAFGQTLDTPWSIWTYISIHRHILCAQFCSVIPAVMHFLLFFFVFFVKKPWVHERLLVELTVNKNSMTYLSNVNGLLLALTPFR